MAETTPTCTEMELAPDLRKEAYRRAYGENARNRSFPGRPHTRYWRKKARLRVRFLDGDPSLHHRVEEAAMAWRSYAHVSFVFGDDPDAEIRITFGEPVLWSYVGTDALLVPTLIQWADARHPSDHLPDRGLRLALVAGEHPEPAAVRADLAALGLSETLKVTYARSPRLAAMIRTPRGVATL